VPIETAWGFSELVKLLIKGQICQAPWEVANRASVDKRLSSHYTAKVWNHPIVAQL